MKYLALFGRILFSAIFITASIGHLSTALIQLAASRGVPYPDLLVPLSGILAFFGGVSIAVGYKARFGALLIIFFLLPVTIMMHKFWGPIDPEVATMQYAQFMKNLSMLGGAFLISYFGAGPLSIDEAIK